MDLTSTKLLIKKVPNYPCKGILFYDLTPIFSNPSAFSSVLNKMEWTIGDVKNVKIASPESRGFIIGSALADRMKLPFIPIRKKGKLPRKTFDITYKTEYSKDTLSIHKDSIEPGDGVILVDDVMATGGTLKACSELIEKAGGEVLRVLIIARISSLWEMAIFNLAKYGYESIFVL